MGSASLQESWSFQRWPLGQSAVHRLPWQQGQKGFQTSAVSQYFHTWEIHTRPLQKGNETEQFSTGKFFLLVTQR